MFSSLGIERDLEVFVIMPPSTNFKPEVWIEEDFCFLFLNFASIDLNVAPAASHERISKILRKTNLFFYHFFIMLCSKCLYKKLLSRPTGKTSLISFRERYILNIQHPY